MDVTHFEDEAHGTWGRMHSIQQVVIEATAEMNRGIPQQYRASCFNCGWHTFANDNRKWTVQVAQKHAASCT